MKNKPRKAQSIIEYICVTMVFAGVSVGGFILANQAATANYRGQVTTYKEPETLQGKILEDGLTKQQYKWQGWDEPQENLYGHVPNEFVDNPDAQTLPIPPIPETE